MINYLNYLLDLTLRHIYSIVQLQRKHTKLTIFFILIKSLIIVAFNLKIYFIIDLCLLIWS